MAYRIKLTDLRPQFLRHEGDAWAQVDTLAEADGIQFQCPHCADACPDGPNSGQPDGRGYRGVHVCICWFVGRVADDVQPGPGRWTPTGTGYGDLSFVQTPGQPKNSVLLNGGCNAHFFIMNGEAHN